jgi:hypothetical protein
MPSPSICDNVRLSHMPFGRPLSRFEMRLHKTRAARLPGLRRELHRRSVSQDVQEIADAVASGRKNRRRDDAAVQESPRDHLPLHLQSRGRQETGPTALAYDFGKIPR